MSKELDLSQMPAVGCARGPAPKVVAKLAGDASTRVYYRVSYGIGQSAVIMLLPKPRTLEEAKFIEIQAFLQDLELPVPRVYSHDPEHGLIVLEDLGDHLLESLVEGADDERLRELYVEAVDLLIGMRLKTESGRSCCEIFNPPFDENKFMEEFGFFVTHFIEGLLETDPPSSARATLDTFFDRISLHLSEEPRIFCHRDYHSRNLILHEGRLVMIDFQDARMGPAQYDLASLLRDSYVTLPEHLVEDLLSRYQEAIEGTGIPERDRFRYVFDVMSLQRNIKALGTFGYQISVRGSNRYLSSIPRTGAYIARTIRLHPEFAPFVPVVEDYICGPAMEMQ
ncbi:MAG: phosphotransferase [Desulfomonile sp.]